MHESSYARIFDTTQRQMHANVALKWQLQLGRMRRGMQPSRPSLLKDIECWAYCGNELAAKAAFGTCFPACGRAVPGHCILATQLSAGRLGRPITAMISQCQRH